MNDHNETPDESEYDDLNEDQPEAQDALEDADDLNQDDSAIVVDDEELDSQADEPPVQAIDTDHDEPGDVRDHEDDAPELEDDGQAEPDEAFESFEVYEGSLEFTLPDSELDIAGALAQVSALSDVIAEQEAREAQEQRLIEAEQRAYEADAPAPSYYFPSPPDVTLERGQLASVIPALVLIVLGSYLTFILTSSEDTTFRSDILLYSGAGAIGIALLAYWLSTGRWMHGALFSGLSVLLTVGTVYALAQTDDPGWRGWPLLLSAVGLAALLSALLSARMRIRQAFAGILLIIAGLIGAVVTTDTLGEDITELTERAGPVILIAIVLLVTVPGLFRFRR